ncbi:MAG: DapH/DapD/GlmU-related protein [Bacteroidota bacterium]|nr:DapH/DapD/GlmU-related protein [Bacteroidota bacterium]
MSQNNISDKAIIGKNVKIGSFNIIEENVTIEDDVEIGNYCHLRSGVVIKKRTRLMDYIELRNNTIIGEDCYVDSKVSSSGNVIVKNNVTLRYDTILARGVEIGAKTYVCPRVMTNNLNSGGIEIGGAKIGENCFIGTNAVLQHGITVGNNVIIGALSFVHKDCEAESTYVGIPAKKIK